MGWQAGVGYFAAGMIWIVEPFLVDAARHLWLAPVALVALSGGLALFWAAGFALARVLAPAGLALALAFAASLTAFELARAYVLTGFPWNLLAYGLLDTPLAQSSALIGPHALGFAIAVIAGLVALRPRGLPMLAATGVALGAWFWGEGRPPEETPTRAFVVRIVQPNAAQSSSGSPNGGRSFSNVRWRRRGCRAPMS